MREYRSKSRMTQKFAFPSLFHHKMKNFNEFKDLLVFNFKPDGFRYRSRYFHQFSTSGSRYFTKLHTAKRCFWIKHFHFITITFRNDEYMKRQMFPFTLSNQIRVLVPILGNLFCLYLECGFSKFLFFTREWTSTPLVCI